MRNSDSRGRGERVTEEWEKVNSDDESDENLPRQEIASSVDDERTTLLRFQVSQWMFEVVVRMVEQCLRHCYCESEMCRFVIKD